MHGKCMTRFSAGPENGDLRAFDARKPLLKKGAAMESPDIAKKLLKSLDSPETVDPGVIKVLDYGYRLERDIEIEIEQPEFTSRCPLSGLPDFGSITIRYTPKEKLVELKSLKYYLLQYRNVGIFYEHVVNRVLEDLVSAVHPGTMEVVGVFTPRGGITTRACVKFEEEHGKGKRLLKRDAGDKSSARMRKGER